MARPEKAGLDYFPLDVGFLRDKKVKLLKTEFGACSVIFVLYVFCRVYEEEGYYLRWDKDECLIAAEAVGCGATPSYIGEVLQRCLSRSLFDQRVFQMFGVLTSAGIQRRYLRGREKRGAIEMIEEYFLLDVKDPKDVPAGILAKLTLKKIFGGKNEVISPENEVNSPENPQMKLNKIKLNKKRDISDDISTQAEETIPSKKHKYGEYHHVLLSGDEYEKLTEKLGADMRDICIEYLDSYIEEKGYKSKSHYLSITRWVVNAVEEREKRQANIQRQGKDRESGTDNVFMQIYEERYGEKHDK